MNEEFDDNIPVLTEIVESSSDESAPPDNEFNFDGLVPGKALTQEDVNKIKSALNQLIKTKIRAHSIKLYQELNTEMNKILDNVSK